MARLTTVLFAMLLILGACSSGSDTGGTTVKAGTAADPLPSDVSSVQTTSPPDVTTSTQPPAGSTAPDPQAGAGEAGTATLRLENGELFEFNVECVTETMEAAISGRDLLLSVNSFDVPYSITAQVLGPDQFGSGPLSTIQIWDSGENEIAWGAYSVDGGQVDLRLDGSTVTGIAVFGEGGDTVNPSVPGEFVAYC